MFWIWFEWNIFADPVTVDDELTGAVKINDLTLFMWHNVPSRYQGMATTIEVMLDL